MINLTSLLPSWLRPSANSHQPSATQLRGIDAVDSNPRLPPVVTDTRAPDEVYNQRRADQFVTVSRDGQTNNTLLQWAINKHLGFVSSFTYRSREKDPGLRKAMNDFIEMRSSESRCDASGRFTRDKLTRFIESHAAVDGDVLEVLVRGQGSELVTSDCIRNPDNSADTYVKGKGGWVRGAKLDGQGRVIGYAVHRRNTGGTYEFSQFVRSGNCRLRGYFRGYRQWRGMSPLVCAANDFRGVYTNKDLAMAKARIAQYFAVKWKFANQPIPGVDALGAEKNTDTNEYKLKLNDAGVASTRLYEGDDVDFMTVDTPGSSFMDLHRVVSDLAVKAFDLPWCLFDESYTNYVGAQVAMQVYDSACKDKQRDNARHLHWWEVNQFQDGVVTGEFDLPSGRTVDSLISNWIPAGLPYWDRGKRIEASREAVSMGLANLVDECHEESGGDIFENIDRNAEVLKYAADKGVPIDLAYRPASPMFDVPPKRDQQQTGK